MILRGIDFGHVWDQSGVRNFDGSGWWYHRLMGPLGLNFESSTFVAKTATTYPRPGNMPLQANGRVPQELLPKCIYVDMRKGVALNAVGLSGPGVKFILESGWWQSQTKPFFISWMPVGKTFDERKAEARAFVYTMLTCGQGILVPYGIQINLSCPNVGRVKVGDFVAEAHALMYILGELGRPLVVKLSVITDVPMARRIADYVGCDAICVSNTIPFGALPDKINWKGLFGSDTVSPLEKRLGTPGENKGGLSGAPLLSLVIDWVREAKASGFPKPINAGGGILSTADAVNLLYAGADSVSLGSVAFLRGWRVAGIIRAINKSMNMEA